MLLCQIVCAQQITGMGYGKTKHEARKEALADLSQNIQVDIKSEFSRMKVVRGTDFKEQKNWGLIFLKKSRLKKKKKNLVSFQN